MGQRTPGCSEHREDLPGKLDEVGGCIVASQIGKWTSDQRVILFQLTRNFFLLL